MRLFMKNVKGSTLLMVLVVLVIVIIFSVTALTIGSASTKQAYNQEMKLQAYYLARSGTHAVASYIVDNPDNLSDSARAAFVSNLVGKTSEPFKLKPDDEGEISTTVTKPSDTLLVVSSTATVGGMTQTVSVDIHVEKAVGIVLTKAAYASGDITMTGDKITGDIFSRKNITITGGSVLGEVYIMPDSKVTVPSWKTDAFYGTPNIQTEYPSFPTINFPNFPDNTIISNVKDNLTVNGSATINKDTIYTGGITVNYGNLAITLGDEDIDIVVSSLAIKSGSITVSRPEGKKGRLNVYVANTFEITGGAEIIFDGRQEGNGRAINIYYKGTKKITLGNGVSLYGLLHVDQAEIEMTGGSNGTLTIITEGPKVTIWNGANVTLDMIYAPNTPVTLTSGGHVKGSIISKSLLIENGSTLTYKPLSTDFDEWTGGSSDKTTYKLGNWH